MRSIIFILLLVSGIAKGQSDSLAEEGYVSEEIKPAVKSTPINLRYTPGQYLVRASNKMIGGSFMVLAGALVAGIGAKKGPAIVGGLISFSGFCLTISGRYQLKLAGEALDKKDH